MTPHQDPKYRISPDGRIVNRASGELIPEDEPIFIFRARDLYAAKILLDYSELVQNPLHSRAVLRRAVDFLQFAVQNPQRMKEPDTAPIT